jgi:hypothetical protein
MGLALVEKLSAAKFNAKKRKLYKELSMIIKNKSY